MAEKKSNKVNEVLGFPGNSDFEAELNNLMSIPEGEQANNVIIAVFDVDAFDPINKEFGRDVGDSVLINFGQFVESRLPESGKIFRIGGDEFGVVFNGDMEREDVFLLMESIRRDLDVKLPDGTSVTISVGIAEAYSDAVRTAELVRKAESALFRAKAAGRNRVALAKEEKMVPKTSHYTADQLKCLSKIAKKEGVGEAILLREALDILIKKYDRFV